MRNVTISSARALRVLVVGLVSFAVSTKGQTLISESDVLGLVQDLEARPVKGPGYVPSRAAIINGTGGIEGAVGGLLDCVRVDGTSGPCSSTTNTADFVVTRTSDSTLSIGSNCSLSTPCKVRFGNLVYSFTSGGTLVLSGGTGVAYIYVVSSGTLVVGHDLTASCTTGCVAIQGAASLPPDVIPLFYWTAFSGSWAPQGEDLRAVLSTKIVVTGAGLVQTESNDRTIISIDGIAYGFRMAVPPTSTSPCTSGSWAADFFFYYRCISQNLWRRAQLSAF